MVRRRGLAPLEAVMTLAVACPLAVLMLRLGVRVCQILHETIEVTVGWPFL